MKTRPRPDTATRRPVSSIGLARGNGSRAAGLAIALAALSGAVAASILIGAHPVSAAQVYTAFTDPTGSDTDRIVLHLRAPRTAVGLLAGLALGAAGTLVQAITRNPLGGPDILGVNAGAALTVVLAIAALDLVSFHGYVWFAFVGAAAAGVVVYAVGSLGQGGATPVKLALAGAAVTAMLGAVTSAVTLLDLTTLNEFRFWSVGSLGAADSAIAAGLLPFIAAGLVIAVALTRSMNALALGDTLASGLGARPHLVRGLGGAAAVLLAGAATAAAGPNGFVGRMAPHAAPAPVGADSLKKLVCSAVIAATLLLAADVLARIMVRPEELQVGVVTALVGAPCFLYLIRRHTLVRL